jgi:molybdate transport system substrate-binding protein
MIRVARVLTVVLAIAQPRVGTSTEIRVFCSNAMKGVMQEVVPQFERSTGHVVTVRYSASADLKRQIEAGEPFDLAVMTAAVIDDEINLGQIVGGTRLVLARSPIAIAIRAGAAKADIRTTDALKRALLASKSIAYAKEGAGGVFFAGLMQRLDLADPLQSKIRLTTTGDEVTAAVARGDAEFGVLPLSEIVAAPGVDVLGVFPAEAQGFVTMVAGVSSRSAQQQLTGELLRFLGSPASQAILKKMGMERP